jgi:hypothetical protein
MADKEMYAMVDRWLESTPAEDEKALVLKEASVEAIIKAASLSKMSAFNKLNKRLHGILDKLSKKAIGDNVVKEIEQMAAIRREAEQLFGPMAREEKEAGPTNVNFQLAFLTQVPTHITEQNHQPAKATVVQMETLPLEEFPRPS